MSDKHKAKTAAHNEQIDQPDLTVTALPDLTRLLTKRARDGDIIQKCKHMLIAGYSPGRVACLLRLPLEKVQELYDNSYNPRCRRFAKTNAYTNAYTNGRLTLTSFNEGAMLAEICATLGLPLFTIVRMLRDNNVAESAINARMPPADDPLCKEYRIVLERKAASRFKPIQLHSNRRKPHPTTTAAIKAAAKANATHHASA